METRTYKYNNPHIQQMSDSIYKSKYGYFLIVGDKWVFTPIEQNFDVDKLMNVIDILKRLNEH